MEIRTLCYSCKSVYEVVGYVCKRDKSNQYKSDCELCHRTGYDYYVRKRKVCNHVWKKVNDVHVCVKCGLTRTYDGKILFDRKLANKVKKVRK